MLIAEQLLLLLTTDEGKAESWGIQDGIGYAGAAIADLALAGRLTFSDEKDPRVRVLSSAPTGHPALDQVLERVAHKDGKKLSSLVGDGKCNPHKEVVASLARAGVIAVEPRRALGFVPERHPVLDPGPERALRERLRLVLAGGQATASEATILSLLQGLDVAPKVLGEEMGSLGKKELKARIVQVAREADAGDAGVAVAKAVEAINVAVATAVIVPIVVSSGS
ncbi:MAG: GPP34 family phosphoprotein [Micrococcales bacterium]|nr:GPP34 family phosphoprotein [Micrococcales bacterium]